MLSGLCQRALAAFAVPGTVGPERVFRGLRAGRAGGICLPGGRRWSRIDSASRTRGRWGLPPPAAAIPAVLTPGFSLLLPAERAAGGGGPYRAAGILDARAIVRDLDARRGDAMAQIVASNAFLNDRAGALRTLLNSSHTLRIFKNNFTPTPANVLADFTEATYTGYAGVSLAGDFAAQTKIQDGEYQTQSTSHTFGPNSGTAQTVYGWYIDDGTNVKLSFKFDNPITVDATTTFSVQVNAQDWAKSIL